MKQQQQISLEELAKHNNEKSCWIMVNNKIYDVTTFLKIHPGSDVTILRNAGQDCTQIFKDNHPSHPYNQLDRYQIGVLTESSQKNLQKIALEKAQKITHQRVKVAIIGGGLSGLNAALKLHDSNVKDIVVLEARERVGGRTCAYVTPKNTKVDLGAGYVGPSQDRYLNLCKRFNLELIPTYQPFDKYSVQTNNRGSRVKFKGDIPQIPFFSLLDLNQLLIDTLDICDTSINVKEPWNSKNAQYYDKLTVQAWLENVAWTDSAKKVYKTAVNAILCCEPTEVSMLFWLWYMQAGGGIFRHISSGEQGAQGYKVKQSTQSVSDSIAKYLGESIVKLSSQVTKIKWNQQNNLIEVYVTKPDMSRIIYEANDLIVAVSPTLYENLGFDPVLPSRKRALATRMPVGSIIKTYMHYDKPYWRDKGFNGITINEGCIVSYTMDHCSGNDYAIMGFIQADQARQMMKFTKEQRMKLIAKQYARAFDCKEMLNPLYLTEKDWNGDKFSNGCYTGIMGPTLLTQLGEELRAPLKNIEFAGTETATWCACQAGDRAAHTILKKLSQDKNNNIKDPGQFQERLKSEVLKCQSLQPSFLEKFVLPSPGNAVLTITAMAIASVGFIVKSSRL